jgi:hypothetical protein
MVEAVFPANDTSMTLHFNLNTSVSLYLMTFPVSIRVGGEVPTMTNLQITSLLGWLPWGAHKIDAANGKILVSRGFRMSAPVGPLSGVMATVDISMPAYGFNRPITAAWDPFPPVHHDPPTYNSAYSHYPLLVGPGGAKTPHLFVPSTCCNHDGLRGDANLDWSLNVADVVYLVDYLFFGGPAPPCFEEGDVNGDGAINVADVVHLVDYLFFNGDPPAPCP